MDYWYIVTKQDNNAEELLHMFWEFHDFRIVEVNYSAARDSVDVLFEYDDRSLRILLHFEGYVQFYVAPIDFEVDWIMGAALHTHGNQVRWIHCELNEIESIRPDEKVTFFQGNIIKWAIVDENGESLPIPEELLHQCWNTYNYKTHQYEEEYHDFTVKPA